MSFVVRATGNAGNVAWLSCPDPDGSRRLGPSKVIGLLLPQPRGQRGFVSRDSAEVFATDEAAKEAILAMIDLDHCAGIVFSVERD